MKLKLTIIILGLLLVSALVYAGGYEVPFSRGEADNLYCRVNAACALSMLTLDNLIVYNISVIGDIFNVTMNLVTWNITESFNVGGNLVAKNITATNYFGNISETTGEHWVNDTGDTMTGNLSIEVATGEDVEIRIQSGVSNKHSYLYLMESPIFGFRLWYDGSGTNTFKFDAIDNDVIRPQIWFDRDTADIDFFANVDLNDNNITADYFFGNILNTTIVNTTIISTINLTMESDLDLIGYTVFANNLGGIVGLLDMRGDPWFLGQTDFEIDRDLKVNNTEVENELTVGGNVTANFYCDDISGCFPIAVLALDTNASTACNDGEYLDGNGLCINLNETIDAKLIGNYYNATTNFTLYGTPSSVPDNDISLTWEDDGQTYNITISAGANALEHYMNFTVNEINRVCYKVRFLSDTPTSSSIQVDLWHIPDSNWEGYHETIFPTSQLEENCITVLDSEHHIIDGKIALRFIMLGNGKAGQKFLIDYVWVLDGYVPITGSEQDPHSWHIDGDNVLTNDISAGGFGIYNLSSIGIGTNNPTSELHVIGNANITGEILGGGSGHDQFSDFVANQHIDVTNATVDFLTNKSITGEDITTTDINLESSSLGVLKLNPTHYWKLKNTLNDEVGGVDLVKKAGTEAYTTDKPTMGIFNTVTYYQSDGYKGILGQNARSFSFLVSVALLTGNQGLFSFGDPDVAGDRMGVRIRTNEVFQIRFGDGQTSSTFTFEQDRIYHIVISQEAGSDYGDTRVWVDGEETIMSASAILINLDGTTNNADFIVGADVTPTIGTTPHDGRISEFAIYDFALTPAQAVALWEKQSRDTNFGRDVNIGGDLNVAIGSCFCGKNLNVNGDIIGMDDLIMNGGGVFFNNLPIDDPEVAGQLWRDNGFLGISEGTT